MTVEEVIAKYDMPKNEQIVLRAAVAYYEKNHSGQTVDFSFVTQEFGGNTDITDLPSIVIQIPGSGENGGRVPVADIDGGTNNTFLMYDDAVGPVHELGHAILALIGVGNIGTDELNIAVLCAMADQAIKSSSNGSLEQIAEELRRVYNANVIDILVEIQNDFYVVDYLKEKFNVEDFYGIGKSNIDNFFNMDTLQTDTETYQKYLNYKNNLQNAIGNSTALIREQKLSIARAPESSFENFFNVNRNYYEKAGLSDVPSQYRTGYVTHEDVGLDDEWTSFAAGTSGDTSGKWTTLIKQGKDVAFLGNQYDKNENGQIDGIDEVFGNLNESGFEELKRLVDSNRDTKIDRRDELFQRLQIWNDFNQDAKVQEGELRSLKDAGVASIDLNYVSTNIIINGNLLAEASKYTTTHLNTSTTCPLFSADSQSHQKAAA